MKKIVSLILVCMSAVLIAACGNSAPAEEEGALKTLGDAFALGSEVNMYSFDSKHYVYVFEKDGTPMRAVADMPDEVYDKLEDYMYNSEDTEEQVKEVVSGLEISSLEDLTENLPSQEELDTLIGKTGQDLLDAGYDISGYSIDEQNTDFFMTNGDFEYVVSFNESLDGVEITDEYAQIAELTVKSIKYSSVSYQAVDLEN